MKYVRKLTYKSNIFLRSGLEISKIMFIIEIDSKYITDILSNCRKFWGF